MIHLYTSFSSKTEGLRTIDYPKDYFCNFTLSRFDATAEQYLAEIDNAKIIDRKLWKIQTPFGICSISEISSGLRALLNFRYLRKMGEEKRTLMDITSCGDNILPYLIDEAKGTEAYLITFNNTMMCDRGAEIIVEDTTRVKSFTELMCRYTEVSNGNA